MIAKALWLTALLASAACCGTVTDSKLGYAITLPANWVQLKSKPSQHYFRDSTKSYHSQISILKYDIDPASYPTPQSWAQAQFIAYKLSVETSVYPFGAVTYYDSTAAAKLGANWAPEAFSVLYPADGDPTYCEFIRYCAVGNVGYEIYAIGDSTDMANNVDFYAGIIATLQFTTPEAGIAAPNSRSFPSGEMPGFSEAYDPAGRKVPESILKRDPGSRSRPFPILTR